MPFRISRPFMPFRISRPLMLLYLAILFLLPLNLSAQERYFPLAGTEWEVRSPSEAGLDEGLINQAVELAMENENSVDRDLRIAILQGFSREPYHDLAGPVRERGGPAGMIVKDGTIVASWGDLERVDITFSVTKSYLSTVAGLAWDRGVIRSLDDRVPDHLYYAAGFGGNYIIVDEENDIVIVTRWLDNAVVGEFVEMVYRALN